VVRLMNDSPTVRDLAAWLSTASGIDVEDRTTPEARSAELARLRDMLEKSGPLGRWAARLLDRLGNATRKARGLGRTRPGARRARHNI
jgi:hypothetical protein